MAFNTLALALAQASQIDGANLGASSEPTLTDATEIHTRAYQLVRRRFRYVGLDPDTLTASSSAESLAKDAESLITSARCLLARSGITEEDRVQAADLLGRARALIGGPDPSSGEWHPGEIGIMRQILIDEGAGAKLEPAETTRAYSRQVDQTAPGSTQNTLGTGFEYTPAPTFQPGQKF